MILLVNRTLKAPMRLGGYDLPAGVKAAIDPARAKPERVFRRAITETPRHDAEVILSR